MQYFVNGSRAAEWRQQQKLARQRTSAPAKPRVVRPHELEMTGNTTTFNVNELLMRNIVASEYYTNLGHLTTHGEMVQEIVARVRHVEPWMQGTTRTASTAFCLLFRLFTLRVTVNEMQRMLAHKSPAMVKCIGLLYIRYTLPAKQLYEWIRPLMSDDSDVTPGALPSSKTTMAGYTRSLLELKYYGTMLPRVPVPIMRAIKVKMMQEEKCPGRAAVNARYRHLFKAGTKIRGLFTEDSMWYEGTIDSEESDGKYLVTYTGYGNSELLDLGRIELIDPPAEMKSDLGDDGDAEAILRRQEARKAVAVGKAYANRPASYKGGLALKGQTTRRGASSRTTISGGGRRRDDRGRDRRRSQSRSRSYERRHSFDRDRDRRRGGGRSRSRSYERGRGREHGRECDRRRGGGRSRSRSRSRGRYSTYGERGGGGRSRSGSGGSRGRRGYDDRGNSTRGGRAGPADTKDDFMAMCKDYSNRRR